MTLFRKFDPNLKTQVSGSPPAQAAKAAKAAKEPQTLASLASLADVLSDGENLPVCIFCKQPVIRGMNRPGIAGGRLV